MSMQIIMTTMTMMTMMTTMIMMKKCILKTYCGALVRCVRGGVPPGCFLGGIGRGRRGAPWALVQARGSRAARASIFFVKIEQASIL